MAENKTVDFLYPRTKQGLGIFLLVMAETFVIYYAILFPLIGGLYLSSFRRVRAEKRGVEIWYFPYVASLANSEAWVIVRRNEFRVGKTSSILLATNPNGDAEVRWGCAWRSNAWLCKGGPPQFRLTGSPLDVFSVQYDVLPPPLLKGFKFYEMSVLGKAVAEFHPVKSDFAPLISGLWARLYYDPWRVFWWQVVYHDLLLPPWSNAVLLVFALLLAYLTEMLIEGRSGMKVGDRKDLYWVKLGLDRIAEGYRESIGIWRLIYLPFGVLVANVVVVLIVVVFFFLITSRIPIVVGDVVSCFLIIAVLSFGFRWVDAFTTSSK